MLGKCSVTQPQSLNLDIPKHFCRHNVLALQTCGLKYVHFTVKETETEEFSDSPMTMSDRADLVTLCLAPSLGQQPFSKAPHVSLDVASTSRAQSNLSSASLALRTVLACNQTGFLGNSLLACLFVYV